MALARNLNEDFGSASDQFWLPDWLQKPQPNDDFVQKSARL